MILIGLTFLIKNIQDLTPLSFLVFSNYYSTLLGRGIKAQSIRKIIFECFAGLNRSVFSLREEFSSYGMTSRQI